MAERRTIEIRPGFSARRTQVEAWCHGEWATHPHLDVPDLWVLTLLPLGLNIAPDWCSFRSHEDALACAAEFQRLRNDWCVITQASLTKALEAQLKAITVRHNAVEGPLGAAYRADTSFLGRRIDVRPNGYGPALD